MTAVTSILEHVCFSTQRNFRGPSEGGVLLKINHVRVSLVAQMVKNLPAMLETWVQSLGWEDPLENGMATHSSILAWRIPWADEPGGLQSMGSQRMSGTTERLTLLLHFQDSCFIYSTFLLVTQPCPTLCDPMDCSLPGSSVDGILQTRILEWVARAFKKSFYE